MKFSEQWLREWVNPALSTQALVSQITMAGLEVDGVEPAAAILSQVVVGEILAAEPHPNADKLKICTVSSGADRHQVVWVRPMLGRVSRYPLRWLGPNSMILKLRKPSYGALNPSGCCAANVNSD